MSQDLQKAAGLIEDLRFVDDAELIDEDLVGCLANAVDIRGTGIQLPGSKPTR